jgi:hypothetical protein
MKNVKSRSGRIFADGHMEELVKIVRREIKPDIKITQGKSVSKMSLKVHFVKGN